MKNYLLILGLVITGSVAGGVGYLALEEFNIIRDPQTITVFLPVMVFCGGLIAYTKAIQTFQRVKPAKTKKWHYVKQIGFSLIEILLVLSLIGLLAAAMLVRFKGIRERARDTRRLADMQQLSSALALYYSSAGGYPHSMEFGSGSLSCGSNVFISKLPQEPTGVFPPYSYLPTGSPTGQNVCGTALSAYSDFMIVFYLEKGVGNLGPATHVMTSTGIK